MIELAGIVKRYTMGEEVVQALRGVDLSIGRNEYVALTGPSGSGKSTLMNLLGCLDSPTEGHYVLNGRDVAGMDDDELARVRNREIGFVFQSFHLLPRQSVFDALHAQGQTVIVVTHEPDIAAHCHRVLRVLDGRIVEDVRQVPRTAAVH